MRNNILGSYIVGLEKYNSIGSILGGYGYDK